MWLGLQLAIISEKKLINLYSVFLEGFMSSCTWVSVCASESVSLCLLAFKGECGGCNE